MLNMFLTADSPAKWTFAFCATAAFAGFLYWSAAYVKIRVDAGTLTARYFWGHSRSFSIAEIIKISPSTTTRMGLGRAWMVQTTGGQTVIQGVQMLPEEKWEALQEALRVENPNLIIA